MHDIFVTRVQHPVGQGGFHMADMEVGGKPFRYIYDCGSNNLDAISAVLAGLHRTTSQKSFDWLVISSFDMDHCNGVALLIAKGYDFKRVFLPHLLDKELLVWLLCCYVLDQRSLAEIATALVSLRVLHALSIRDKRDGDGPDNVLEPISTEHTTPGAANITYHVKDADWMFRFYSRETDFADLVKDLFKKGEFKELKAIMDRVASTVTSAAQDPNTATILDELFAALREPPKQAPAPRASKAKTGTPANAAAASPATGKRTVKQLLGDAYESLKKDDARVFGDYNEVSLCLYSGPRTKAGSTYSRFSVECPLGGYSAHSDRDWTRRVGWLGLGDIGFRHRALLDQLTLYYGSELALSCTKMVPHHGAQSNYGTQLPMLAPFFALDAAHTLWIAAAHPLTRYRHPAGVVVLEAEKNGTFVMVSDDPGSRVEETIRSIPAQAVSGSGVRYLIHLLRKAGYR